MGKCQTHVAPDSALLQGELGGILALICFIRVVCCWGLFATSNHGYAYIIREEAIQLFALQWLLDRNDARLFVLRGQRLERDSRVFACRGVHVVVSLL